MSLLRRFTRLTLPALLLCCLGSWAHAQQPSAPRAASNQFGHMRVIENANRRESLATYTVVGAVGCSGVYVTSEKTLPISRLIENAGGLNPDAFTTLRVIRNREVRFQLQYSPMGAGTNDLLLPGDIVVVPSRAKDQDPNDPASPVVPVACLGLIDRPVVLTLVPSINTVDELVHRLLQHPQVARSATIIDPIRGGSQTQLTSGSVIIFDTRLIDGLPLKQPGALPAWIDLDQTRTSAYPGILPANTELPPACPAAQIVQQVSADMIVPSTQPRVNTSPLTLPVPQMSHQTPMEQGISVAPQVLEGPVTNPIPQQGNSSTLPAELAEVLELFAPAHEESHPPVIEQQSASLIVESTDIQPTPARSASVSEIPPTIEEPATPGVEDVAGDTGIVQRESAAEIHKTQSVSQASRSNTVIEYLMFCGAGISILIGASLLLSMAFGTAAPAAGQVVQTSSPISTISVEPIRSTARAQKSTGASIQELLNRAIPVVEEQIQVPSAWPLHGIAVGHRRLIVNSAHDGVAGPHFAKREKLPEREKISMGSSKAAERHLRNSLREICRTTPDDSDVESLLGNSQESSINDSHIDDFNLRDQSKVSAFPADIASANDVSEKPASINAAQLQTPMQHGSDPADFDIVLPPPPAQTAAMSPLERALRTLASEKRG